MTGRVVLLVPRRGAEDVTDRTDATMASFRKT